MTPAMGVDELDQSVSGPDEPTHVSPIVLVADDDTDVLDFVTTLLVRDGYRVLRATNGKEALDLAHDQRPDLLVLDVSMPVLDGYSVCKEVQALGRDAPPVIFLTARAETKDRIVGLDAGAVDYVVKPFSGAELRARVRAALRTKVVSDRLKIEAATDPLTGLHNRSQLGPGIAELVGAARRHGRPLSCLMIDLDHFKATNDTYGHQAGDAVLVEVAHRLSRVRRASDMLIRYGGEEFLFLLPDTDASGAFVFADKLRTALAERPVSYAAPTGIPIDIWVRASVGISSLDDSMYDAALLVAAADDAMYRAKANGRDRIAVANGP